MTLPQKIIIGIPLIIVTFVVGFILTKDYDQTVPVKVPSAAEVSPSTQINQTPAPAANNASNAPAESAPTPQQKMQTLIAELEQKVEANKHTLEDVLLLGRSQMMAQQFEKAIVAFDKALELDPKSLDAMIPLADAIAATQKGQFTGRAFELLQQANQIDPENPMVLWLLGGSNTQQNNPEQAAIHWTKLYNQLPAGSENKIKVGQQLEKIGKAPADYAEQTALYNKQLAQPAAAKTITVHLAIPEDVRAKLTGTTAFVYAKAQTGMPMPIAAKRMPSEQLPATLTISAEDELMPNRKLADVTDIKVGIKISKQANVDQGGDLFRTELNLPASNEVTLNVKF